jgi:cytochrome P450
MFMTKRNEDILSNLPVMREFHNIFLGGVHAGAITVIWALEELAWNPRTMKKAQDEIRNSVGKKGRLAEESIDELHPGNKRNSEMATLLLHYFSQEKPCLTVKSMVITFTPKY